MATFIEVLNYGHPGSHSVDIITESTDKNFVTDAQITEWSAVKTKVIDIGPWDMTQAVPTLQQYVLGEGIDASMVRWVSVMINNDLTQAAKVYHPLTNTGTTAAPVGGQILLLGVAIRIFAESGGFFDTADYSSLATTTRGKITFGYEV